MRSLFSRLFEVYRPVEEAVLKAVGEKLAGPARGLFFKQMEMVNKVQRHAQDKEINLYIMRHGKAELEPELRFPNAAPELKLATVQVEDGAGQSAKVEVWLANGRVFTLEFNRPFDLSARDMRIKDVTIHADPMAGGQAAGSAEAQATLPAKVPADYVEIADDLETVEFQGWKVYGPAHARKVVQPERNYYILAEKESQGAVAVAEDEQSGQLFYFDYEASGESPEPAGNSLRAFIAKDRALHK